MSDRSSGGNKSWNTSSSHSSSGKHEEALIIVNQRIIQVLPGEAGEYDIVYSLPKEGRYRMWIRIYGIDIQDSPFQVSGRRANLIKS